jgi:alpha-amylase
MATKFFSDGAVHAYFNPYETPYDAFMNYMNVLSDFEIRLNKFFPDTAEQDQIYKLGAQIIEKEMIIEKQAFEIDKLTKKVSKIKPVKKSAEKSSDTKTTKTTPVKPVSTKTTKTTPVKPVSLKTTKTTPVKPASKVRRSKKAE